MHDYRVRVFSETQIQVSMSATAKWTLAEEACRAAASSLGVNWFEEPGEVAFYGPKIDFVVKDVIGRVAIGNCQVDYNLPERFELQYKGSDGEMHRPVMITELHSVQWRGSASANRALRRAIPNLACTNSNPCFDNL